MFLELSNRHVAGSHRQHDHLGPDTDAAVEVGNILIGHPDAAGRHLATYGPRFVRAVDAVKRRAEIHGASAERIVGAASHKMGQIRSPPKHLGRRRPIGPFPLLADTMDTRPRETVTADADAIAERLPTA